jgi:tRNA G10  N-methylase Trm11
MQCFAVLGSHPDLSLAELRSVTGVNATNYSKEAAIFEFDGQLGDLQKRLGGTQKLGVIVGSLPVIEKTKAAEFLASQLTATPSTGRISFGLSAYALGGPGLGALKKQLPAIGLETKKILKAQGQSARLVTSKEDTLSTVVVTKNKLIEQGGEFVFLVTATETLIGLTSAVQDFEDWSHRDFGRPWRDAKRGMMPPKLSRMMVNLAVDAPTSHSLLDPFCGSGTILMEAAMIGVQNLIGSDIDSRAVLNSGNNLRWIFEQTGLHPKLTLQEASAATVNKFLRPGSIDAIITEPFLGKNRTGRESRKEAQEIADRLTAMYRESFAALRPLLKPNGRLVVALPIHYVAEAPFELSVEKIFLENGYRLDPIANERLIYRHPGQYVGREIIRLKT